MGYLLLLIRLLLGAIFIFSAWAKLFPIEVFEYTLVDSGLIPWRLAPFVSRLILGFEWTLGSLLLLQISLPKRTVEWSGLLLTLFLSVYLIGMLLSRGNESNCGCFGDILPLSTVESLYKNAGIIALFIILLKGRQGFQLKLPMWLTGGLIAIGFAFPFVLNPPGPMISERPNTLKQGFMLDFTKLDPDKNESRLRENLMEGKRIVAFLSLTCPHCRIGAMKLNVLKKQHPEWPIYFILNGDLKDQKAFFENSKTTSIPYSYMSMKEGFLENSTASVPSIFLVEQGKALQRISYLDLNESILNDFFKGRE